ncbi:MAG: hypothetical protein KGI73_03225 [Patescibacteria group bacterium]|nr:hypothetical protein [Patescibacteria group bacterium]
MGYLKSTALVVLAVYMSTAAFGALILPQLGMAGSVQCTDAMFFHGECPHALAASTLHHATALRALAEAPLANPLLLLAAALIALVALWPIVNATLRRERGIRYRPVPELHPRARKLSRYLSRFERSPALA